MGEKIEMDREAAIALSCTGIPLPAEYGDFAGWRPITAPTIVDERRWGVVNEQVVAAPNDTFWRITYSTSVGDGDSYSDEPVDVVQVRPVRKTITAYEPMD